MLIESAYQDYIQEGYLLSDKDISIDLDQFESGKKNKLIVIGVSGSGKTTLAEYLYKQYRTPKWYSMDSWWWRIHQKEFPDQKDMRPIKKKIQARVIEESIRLLKNKDRMVIEGVDIVEAWGKNPTYKNLISNQPMIILGLSSLRAGLRAGMRNLKRGGEGMKELYWMVEFNMRNFEHKVKAIRKHIQTMPGRVIKPYKIPKNIV